MIIKIIIWLFLLGTLAYFIVLLLVINGLLGLKPKPPKKDEFVTVIISFRNEASSIADLLKSFMKLTYPIELYEVIFVNDGSTDGGEKLIESELDQQTHWHLMSIDKKPEHLRGKKFGLTKAIERSKGEIILTTDADCEVSPNWIQTMLGCLTSEIGVVLGHSIIHERVTFFHRFISFDGLFGSAIAAAGAFYNKPPHSSGRNLMFRKRAFFDVKGYSNKGHVDSGDDFFLSQAIREKTDWEFDFCLDPDAYVFTKAYPFGKEFLHQQIRRKSKTIYHTAPFFLVSLGILLHIIGFPLFVLSGVISMLAKLAILIAKISLEIWAISVATRKFHLLHLMKYYPIMAVLYPAFILLFSIAGSFKLYRWK